MNTYSLDNWSLVDYPETNRLRLYGEIYNNEYFDEGEKIITNYVVGKCRGMVQTEDGVLYDLMDVDPEYEKKFPDAYERLMNLLNNKEEK